MHEKVALVFVLWFERVRPGNFPLLNHLFLVNVDQPRSVGENQLPPLGKESLALVHKAHQDHILI